MMGVDFKKSFVKSQSWCSENSVDKSQAVVVEVMVGVSLFADHLQLSVVDEEVHVGLPSALVFGECLEVFGAHAVDDEASRFDDPASFLEGLYRNCRGTAHPTQQDQVVCVIFDFRIRFLGEESVDVVLVDACLPGGFQHLLRGVHSIKVGEAFRVQLKTTEIHNV